MLRRRGTPVGSLPAAPTSRTARRRAPPAAAPGLPAPRTPSPTQRLSSMGILGMLQLPQKVATVRR